MTWVIETCIIASLLILKVELRCTTDDVTDIKKTPHICVSLKRSNNGILFCYCVEINQFTCCDILNIFKASRLRGSIFCTKGGWNAQMALWLILFIKLINTLHPFMNVHDVRRLQMKLWSLSKRCIWRCYCTLHRICILLESIESRSNSKRK